ncbi:MAG: phage portal protein [Pirellulaceae bacterium]
MNALAKAFADTDRSYFAAKASVAATADALLASGPSGLPTQKPDLARAAEQLRHFRGWVFAAIRPIAQRIAGQPIHVGKAPRQRQTKDARPEPLSSHPLLDLLADPNDLMVAWSLIYSMIASLELTGRQLWWLPERKQILPIPTSWLVGMEGATKITAFRVRPPYSGETFDIPAEQCCYFVYPDPSDPHGALSPLQAAASAVNSDELMQQSQASTFRQGINPGHALIVGKEATPDGQQRRPRLSPAQQRQLIGAIRKRYEGAMNHGEPLILDALIEDVKVLSRPWSKEMDFLNSGKMTKERICQIFGVSPYLIGGSEPGSRAASAVAEQHFIAGTINPKIELLSQTLTEWLAPMFGGEIVVWIEPCTANDAEMELRRMELAAKFGALRMNELRTFVGLPEDDAFDGVLIGGRNMSTTGSIESGLRQMVGDALADIEADNILSCVQMQAANRWTT